MKRLLFFSVVCLLFVSLANQACQAECKAVCGNGGMMNKITAELGSLGRKVENVEMPIVGKLGAILPIAVVAFCLQKFPGQTMALLTCGLAYGLYCNEKVRDIVRGCSNMKLLRNKKTVENMPREDQFEDDFFAFNGEDELDVEEEEDDEDDLLDESLDFDLKKAPVSEKKALSFL